MSRRALTTAVVLLFLASALAGCLAPAKVAGNTVTAPANVKLAADGVSAKQYDKVVHEQADIPTFDGKTLAVDIWRPEVPNGTKVPVVAVISPYMGNELTDYRKDPAKDNYPTIYGPYRFLVDVLAPAGYGIALVDLRGTRDSGGCIDLAGPNEQKDAGTVAEWLGTRPWSSGKVAFQGKSYDGLTSLEALVSGNAHVAALVVEAPVYGWYPVQDYNGVPYTNWNPATAADYAAIDNSNVKGFDPVAHPAALTSYADQWECADHIPRGSSPTGDYDDWFTAHDLRAKLAKATAPVFYVQGLQDINAKPDNAVPWYANMNVPKKGYFWQAPHEWPTYEYDHKGKEEFTGRTDFWHTVHRWYDHWLLGIDNGIQDELNAQVQDQLGNWHNETTFPPTDSISTPFYLATGKLADAPGSGSAVVDQAAAAPMFALANGPSGAMADPTADDLRFTTETLAHDLRTSGVPLVTVSLSASTPEAQLVAELWDVAPAGNASLVNHGIVDMRHLDGPDKPAVYQPGTAVVAKVPLMPQDYVFQGGHKIMLRLRASAPEWWFSPGSPTQDTLTFGKDSALHLPVVHRDAKDIWMNSWGEKQVRTLGEVIYGNGSPP